MFQAPFCSVSESRWPSRAPWISSCIPWTLRPVRCRLRAVSALIKMINSPLFINLQRAALQTAGPQMIWSTFGKTLTQSRLAKCLYQGSSSRNIPAITAMLLPQQVINLQALTLQLEKFPRKFQLLLSTKHFLSCWKLKLQGSKIGQFFCSRGPVWKQRFCSFFEGYIYLIAPCQKVTHNPCL